MGDVLSDDLIVTGEVVAHLTASTTGTDADFIVKVIDVYPKSSGSEMESYQFPVAMEVFRGRFRKSFDNPIPMVPNKPENIVIGLHQINHEFKKGHRLMVQIQSSWFPIIDRNPQKYVPNIFEATPRDYIKATEKIYCNVDASSYIELSISP